MFSYVKQVFYKCHSFTLECAAFQSRVFGSRTQ